LRPTSRITLASTDGAAVKRATNRSILGVDVSHTE
jgi:hypothetical protein